MTPLLEVRNLQTAYRSAGGADCHAVAGVTFDVSAREILGVLGESGSGKSTLAASLLQLLPPNGQVSGGTVLLKGNDVTRAEPAELRALRGARMSLIFQEPSMALHPTMRVSDQIGEVLRAHGFRDRNARRARTREVLQAVFPSDVDRIAASYPHQLSGGQRQRVVIAQAIACRPAVLIADEPTASLDATTQKEILALFKTLRQERGLAIILITHNPALLAGFADRILVLYAGKVAELGPAQDVLLAPQHPYARALLRCMPQYDENEIPGHKAALPVIPGGPPNLSLPPQGCAFEPRCADRMQICQTREPASVAVSESHGVSCLKFTS